MNTGVYIKRLGFGLVLLAGVLAMPAGLQADTSVAWQVDLALPQTVSIRSYDLVDGYLYATGTDGVVRSFRADTGRPMWTRTLAGLGEVLRPPVAYHSSKLDAVAFGLAREVVLLDPVNGTPVRRINLVGPNVTLPAFSQDLMYVGEAGKRLQSYRISDSLPGFSLSSNSPLRLAPVYVESLGRLILVDSGGRLAGADGAEAQVVAGRRKRFSLDLEASPVGWLSVNGTAIYVATTDRMLHAVDPKSGDRLWRYRLADRPAGGPIVTADSVYQATMSGGLHRIGKEPVTPNWLDPEARQFLAEWPQGVAVLHNDGQIVLVDRITGKPGEVLDVAVSRNALSNPFNDAIFLTEPEGRIRCIRPRLAKPLTLADFRPAPKADAAPVVGDAEEKEKTTTAEPESKTETETEADSDPGEVSLNDPLRSNKKLPE